MTYAVYNPHGKPVDQLPAIYGFNNGGSPGLFSGVLIAEDGTGLGGHVCSHEWFMPGDLGVLEGSRSDRHEGFRQHYPDGYRMEFVRYDDFDKCDGLKAACERASRIEAAPADETQSGSAEGESLTGEAGDAQTTPSENPS